MRSLAGVTILLAILIAGESFGQPSPAQEPKETGTITGRVTLDGKPAQGVSVLATPSRSDLTRMDERMLNPTASSKATTDSDGRYRLEGVPAGTYNIGPSAPTLVSLEPPNGHREVTVDGDKTIERIDFSLGRGGVITGRITDTDGRPVIAALITLKPLGKPDTAEFLPLANIRMFFTDDRGVYRIFGLPPGRYLMSAGSSDNSPFGQLLAGQRRVRTYYPGVTAEPNAKPLEVAAGQEVAGIDLKLGVPARGFVVSGRVIEAESRKPVAKTMVTYSAGENQEGGNTDEDEDDDGGSIGDLSGVAVTNTRGEFRLESVSPGRFRARVELLDQSAGASEYYADPVDFEVRAANVDNLEIPVHRGASISGVVVLENSQNAEAREQLLQLTVRAFVTDPQTRTFSPGTSRVAADGSFRIGGLKAGKAKLDASSSRTQKVSLFRVERNGVEQPDGLQIQPNEQVTGVRLVMAETNCLIRGHVILQGGALASGSMTTAIARAASGPRSYAQWTGRVDEKGDFVIENLPPGSYEVWASNYVASSGEPKSFVSVKQIVSVASGAPAEVILLLDLSASERDK